VGSRPEKPGLSGDKTPTEAQRSGDGRLASASVMMQNFIQNGSTNARRRGRF
jgi:hypothetical protein